MRKHAITLVRVAFLLLFLFLLLTGKAMLWLGVFLFSLPLGLIFGRIYCGYACPMNTLMNPMEILTQKKRIPHSSAPDWLKSGKFPLILLIVSVVAMLASKRFLSVDIPILAIFLLLSILVSLRYGSNVFHQLICPFGFIQQLIGRFARFSKRVDPICCIGCRKCEAVCPSLAILVNQADRKVKIDKSLCHQCTACQSVCPKNAIHYSKVI